MSSEIPFLDHLSELRKRLLRSTIAVIIGFAIAYLFSKQLFNLLIIPILEFLPENSKNLNFTNPIEPFLTYLKIGFIGGIFFAAPYIFYQLWRFVSPGLYPHEKRYVFPFVSLSSIFFIGGAFFGYFVVFPIGFNFFLSFVSDIIKPIITLKEYLSLSTKLLLGFGLIFETPVLIVFLSMAGILDPKSLLSKWRYVIVIVAILSAVLTPPDVGTMILMMAPLLTLFFISVGLALLVYKKNIKT